MTWTKLGAEFWPTLRHKKLSDAAARTHAEAVAYLYNVEEGGCRFEKDLLPAIAASKHRYDAADELVQRGLWADVGDEYEVLHHRDVLRESLAAQHKKKDRDRRAQQAARTRKSADVSADISGDAGRQTASPSGSEAPSPRAGAHDEPWPYVPPPGSLEARAQEKWASSFDR